MFDFYLILLQFVIFGARRLMLLLGVF